MKMTTLAMFVVGALVIALGLANQLSFNSRIAAADRATQKLKRYCTTVYAGIDMDADELTNGTPKRQESAAARFGELVTYHSEQEIALCAKQPVDLSTRGACMIEHDYECLAKLAQDAAKATKP